MSGPAGFNQERKYSSFPGEIPPPTPDLAAHQDAGYKPLSILSILGCIVGGLFCVSMVAGFTAAFVFNTPWLMPPWILFWPGLAILLCAMGYQRARASENTLGGEKLAHWGMRLTGLFILCYLAHYSAIFFAVRSQADQFARQWMAILGKGELDKGFLLTIKPPRPPEDAQVRSTLEITYNAAMDPLSKGVYSGFKARELVRLMQLSGGKVQSLVLKSASAPAYEGGGYQVRLIYHIEGPDGSFEPSITVLGMESPTGAFKGRQWQVLLESTGMNQRLRPKDGTRRKLEHLVLAVDFAQKWTFAAAHKIWEIVIPGTLSGPEKALAEKGAVGFTLPPALTALGGGSTFAAETPERRAFLQQANAVFEGKLYKLAPDFWSDSKMKDSIMEDLRVSFRPTTNSIPAGPLLGPSEWIRIDPAVIPDYQQEGNKIRIGFDCLILLFPRYQIFATLYLEGEDLGENQKIDWRVAEISVTRGASMPGGGPGGRGGPR
ncbi:MAG: hypothetical protein EXR99_15295 [Gemmataceae bacterium]|nr:hypothetical protein [Gemmataceae bacterium]